MKKYNLTNEEKEIVSKFRHYSIPFLFKSGKYCGYLQYFEFVDFEICERKIKLLIRHIKGRSISYGGIPFF